MAIICPKASGWIQVDVPSRSDPSKYWRVSVSEWGGICECKGWRFRQTCYHVDQAEKELCSWDEFSGDLPKDGKCPWCGSRLEEIA